MDWDKIDPQDTNVIMHVYRGEVQRINTWRKRMDRSTNWAVVITVGVLTFALSNSSAPHWTLLPGLFLAYMLLFTEARRYRHFDAWRGRVRALEEVFLAKFFDPSVEVDEGWQEVLSRDLRKPQYKITWEEAVLRRLKRIYIWLILIFVSAWIGKIYIHPTRTTTIAGFFDNIAGPMGTSVGIVIFCVIIGTVLGSILYFFLSAPEREAKGKIRPEDSTDFCPEDYLNESE